MATAIKIVAFERGTIRLISRTPPHLFFFISAVFHYLGPAFAVLLFAHMSVFGVVWLRIASAAVVFAVWRRPWRSLAQQSRKQILDLIMLGVSMGLMNVCFYNAIDRLPLSTVSAIEFIGPVLLTVFGVRSMRNIIAIIFAAAGGWILTGIRFGGEPVAYLFAFANCALFVLYIVLGHRIAQSGGTAGIDRLGLAMGIALITVIPIGLQDALPSFRQPHLLLAGIGVGLSSSVIPYVCDQLVMTRFRRETFSLLLALLPAFAVLIGVVVLHQAPSASEILGILLVAIGVALHREHKAGVASEDR